MACTGGYVCQAGACVCPTNTLACGMPPLCVNVTSSNANCGACGNKCPSGQVCDTGQCGCSGNKILCDGKCVNPKTDDDNCGACGVVCPNGCSNGMCQ
ncbi:MAG: hypothetical protein QM820_45660 [Minicystis sp.]